MVRKKQEAALVVRQEKRADSEALKDFGIVRELQSTFFQVRQLTITPGLFVAATTMTWLKLSIPSISFKRDAMTLSESGSDSPEPDPLVDVKASSSS